MQARPSTTFRRSISGLFFIVLLALMLPNLPLAHAGRTPQTWDSRSYAILFFAIVPVLCIWLAAGRNKLVEGIGWALLLFLIIGSVAH